MEFNSEAISKSTELGFLACRWPSLGRQARAIFAATGVARPNSPARLIGEAMVCLNCDNDSEKAVRFLKREGISGESGALACRAFLGLSLFLANRQQESRQVLKQVVDNDDGSDPDAITLAKSMLDGTGEQ